MTLLEDYRPIDSSLDWRLSGLYYAQRGNHVFLSGDVPFTINNDGYLSKHCAELLFVALTAAQQRRALPAEVHLLELGAGTGLFARFFLNDFRALCSLHQRDYYGRLRYTITDGSPRMLEDLIRTGVLDDHKEQCRFAAVDASSTRLFAQITDCPAEFHAVFLNYILDSLPAAVVRFGTTGLEELFVRTQLSRNARLEDSCPFSERDAVEAITSGDPARLAPLVDAYPLLHADFRFHTVQRELPFSEQILSFCRTTSHPVIHSYGALRCIDQLLGRLCGGGFVLINDYAQTEVAESSAPPYQRFGGSTAIGLNLDLLKTYVSSSGAVQWIEPQESNEHLQSRLIGRDIEPAVTHQFRTRFTKSIYDWIHEPLETARRFARDGRQTSALAAYREALVRQPSNWVVTQETARYLLTANEPQRARQLAESALALNPLSPEGWNTLGDSFWLLGEEDLAHLAFLQALHVYPADVRARYNLVYTLARKGDLGPALQIIAEALLYDVSGEFRERLLERQNEILDRLRRRYQTQTRMMADRSFEPVSDARPALAGGRVGATFFGQPQE